MTVFKYQSVLIFLLVGCISVDDFAAARFAENWWQHQAPAQPMPVPPEARSGSEEGDGNDSTDGKDTSQEVDLTENDDSKDKEDSADTKNPKENEDKKGSADEKNPKEKEDKKGSADKKNPTKKGNEFFIHAILKTKKSLRN